MKLASYGLFFFFVYLCFIIISSLSLYFLMDVTPQAEFRAAKELLQPAHDWQILYLTLS